MSASNDSLRDMQAQLKIFNHERDWEQFHCPRNLAMSLSVEAAELLECFLWTRDDEPIPDNKKTAVAEEAADVLICLLNFCERAGVDLPQAFAQKLAKNAAKYPVSKARGSREKYDAL
ncbi:MAG: nucleotide pyrophosphohydrolase [Proteobacteria bacterium]|nr:nucleotide pyrophosphohydrolase [Pseudomonadota bacterium]